MLLPEEHFGEQVLACLQRTVQHLLQRHAGLHRRFAGEGAGQRGQLHRDDSPLHRGQQEQRGAGQGQLREGHREMREGHPPAQHQEEARVGQAAPQDAQGHRVAQPPRVQPLPVEGVDAHGALAVLLRPVRGRRLHLRLHEPPLRDPARHLRARARLAGQVLHRAGLALRRRGRHPQHGARLHTLARAKGVGLHLRRLLHTHGRPGAGHPLSEAGHPPRDAPQAEGARMVSHGAAAGGAPPQHRGLQGLPPRGAPEPALRAGVQRTHRHDRGAGQGAGQEDDWPPEAHGPVGQQQRVSRPGVLCHRKHLPGPEGHGTRHRRLREGQREGHAQRHREGRAAAPPGRPLLAEGEVRRRTPLLWRGHRPARQGARRLRAALQPLEGARRAGALHRRRAPAGQPAGPGEDGRGRAQQGHRPRHRRAEEEGKGGAQPPGRGEQPAHAAAKRGPGQHEPQQHPAHHDGHHAEQRRVVLLQRHRREPGQGRLPAAVGQARERGQLAAGQQDGGGVGGRGGDDRLDARLARPGRRHRGLAEANRRQRTKRPAQAGILPGANPLHRGAGAGQQRHPGGRALPLGSDLQGQARQPAPEREGPAQARRPIPGIREEGRRLLPPLPALQPDGAPGHGRRLRGQPEARIPRQRIHPAARRPVFQGERTLRHAHRGLALHRHLRGLQERPLRRGGRQHRHLDNALPPGGQPRQVPLHRRTEQAEQRRRRRMPGRHEGSGGQISREPSGRDGGNDCERGEPGAPPARGEIRPGRCVEQAEHRAQRQRLDGATAILKRAEHELCVHGGLQARLGGREQAALQSGQVQLHNLPRAQLRHPH